jgi:hypothetical protein
MLYSALLKRSAKGACELCVVASQLTYSSLFSLILNGLDLSSFGENILDPDIDLEDFFD